MIKGTSTLLLLKPLKLLIKYFSSEGGKKKKTVLLVPTVSKGVKKKRGNFVLQEEACFKH